MNWIEDLGAISRGYQNKRWTTLSLLVVGLFTGVGCWIVPLSAEAREPDQIIDIWPGLAPGETTQDTGETLPRRPNENPPATRVTGITKPQIQIFEPPAKKKTGTAVLIFPGGGYNYVVTDKEGSEVAAWLNELGITGIVVHYRTKRRTISDDRPLWFRSLQDGQRAVSLVRSRAKEWGLQPDQIGVIGFSAGGQTAALVATQYNNRAFDGKDDLNSVSCRPDFCMLLYPWRIADEKTGKLIDAVTVTKDTPPTLLIHAHNDSATSLSSVYFYTAMKKHGRPCELHIFESGGHGYGMRPVPGSHIHTWVDRATDWLKQHQLAHVE